MGSSKQEVCNSSEETSNIATSKAAYLSPVAEPLLNGKTLRRSLKLINIVSNFEKSSRQQSKEDGNLQDKKRSKTTRLLRRGVQEVTKSLRKGEKGLVFLASDIYPVDIAAHIPGLCEAHDIPYAYLCSKKSLGIAFRSKRPASVLMVVTPEGCKQLKTDDTGITEAYEKVGKGIRQVNPYL